MNRRFREIRDLLQEEQGSTTAEFAMVTLAAVAFAGLLISILSSGDVRGMLMGLMEDEIKPKFDAL